MICRTLASIIILRSLAPLVAARGIVEEEGRWESRPIYLFFFWELRLLNNTSRFHQNNFIDIFSLGNGF